MTDTLVIAPGDVVTLKSGGPAMTVEGLHAAPHNVSELIKQTGQMARVAWADAGGMVQQSQFWLHMLVKKAEDKGFAAGAAQPTPRGPVFTPEQPQPVKLDPNRDRPDGNKDRPDATMVNMQNAHARSHDDDPVDA